MKKYKKPVCSIRICLLLMMVPLAVTAQVAHGSGGDSPPGPVTEISVLNGNGNMLLSWKNPDDHDLAFIRVVFNNLNWPGNIHDAAGKPSTSDASDVTNAGMTVRHRISGLPRTGEKVFYSIYTVDTASNATLSYSNIYTVSTRYDTAPPIPSGVKITPTRTTLEITWDASTAIDHYSYAVLIHTHSPDPASDDLLIAPKRGVLSTNTIVIQKTWLGLSDDQINNNEEQIFYVSVADVDFNLTPSDSWFTNAADAVRKGIRVVYRPQTSNAGSSPRSTVYNTFFRPDRGGYARVLVNMPSDNHLAVKVYSISGTLLQTLVNKQLTAGEHEFRWTGTDGSGIVNPGVYFVHARSGGHNKVHKVIVRR